MSSVRELYGMACPECGDDTQIHVVITSWATLSPDGTETYGDHDWDSAACCSCMACRFHGRVGDFHFSSTILNESPDQ